MKENQEESKKTSYFKGFSLTKIRKDQLIVILLFGILLLVIVIPTKKTPQVSQKGSQTEKNTQKNTQRNSDSTDAGTNAQYIDQMEARLETMLKQVEGVGKVKVMLTVKGTGEVIVEKDKPQTQSQVSESDSNGGSRETTENSWEESTVYIQNEEGNKVPYVAKELEPEIEGVLIIAQGGGNAAVVKNICDAVQALFRVEIHKIKVMKME